MKQLKIIVRTIVLLSFLFSNFHVAAQSFSIKAKIISSSDNNPIVGATAVLEHCNKTASTNTLGNFYFSNLSKGNYHLIVSYLGFEKMEQDILLDENKELQFSLKNVAINLSEVTISPTKSITQSESISGVDKLLRPINTAQDLLTLVPGLFIAQHAGGGKAEQIFLRGFDCDHGTDFNISIDGMPVNMVSHAHGQGYADFHFVIPETVNQLKVYKGPYTAKFGDFATTGTGEFSTKNSIDQNLIKAEVGMFNTYRALGMFNLLGKKHLFTKEKENWYVAGEYVFTNAYFINKQNFNRYNLFTKYSGLLNKNNYFTFSASTFSAYWNASGQIPERAVEEGIMSRFGSIDPSEGGQTKRTNINAILTTTLKNDAVIKNQFYFVNYFFNLYSNFTYFLIDPIHGDEINQTDQRNILGYLGTYQRDYSIANKILHSTFGIGTRNDFTHLALKHTEKRMLLDTIVSGKVYQQNTNAYADFTLDVSKHFSINAGVRIDYFQFHFTDDKYDSLSGKKSILRASPKLNFYYSVNNHLQFYLKSGIGFHSNDARAVVINHVDNNLPKAYGSEIGSEFKLTKNLLVNIDLWELYLQSELVYAGDDGTVETNNPTQRYGTELSIRYQLSKKIFADVDFNYNHGRLVGAPDGANYIPLAPRLTSIGGLNYKQEKGLNASIRFRCIDSRPANETNSVTAKGYFLIDVMTTYKMKRIELGFSIENLLNAKWNQAQFDTKSRLYNETAPVTELHFTPGTPFFLKGIIAYHF